MRHILFEVRKSIEDRSIYMGIIIPVDDSSINIFREALMNLKCIYETYRSLELCNFMDSIIKSDEFVCMHQSSILMDRPAYTIYKPLITYARRNCKIRVTLFVEDYCFRLQFFDKLSLTDFRSIFGKDADIRYLGMVEYPNIKVLVGNAVGFYSMIDMFDRYLIKLQDMNTRFFTVPCGRRNVWILKDCDDTDE